VNRLEILDDKKIKIYREISGGNQEIYEMDLPCVLSIQTGINEPRYVPVRGVMRAADLQIPVHGALDLGISPDSVGESGAHVKRKDYFVPDTGEGAEMLEGSTEEIVEKLIDLLKSQGGIR
jgi:electron transfer flavoprotein beta subunit